MSFLLSKNKTIRGLFVHVPKCGGTSTIRMFSNMGYELKRPRDEYLGHHTLKYTLSECKEDFSLSEIKDWTIHVSFREPVKWTESFFRYCIENDSSGCRWELANFQRIGILEYIDMMRDSILNDKELPSGTSPLPYRKLSSYVSVDPSEIEGLEDVKVVMHTNSSISNLISYLNPKISNPGPKENTTSGRSYLLEALNGDTEKYDEYAKMLYDLHYDDYRDIFDSLFENKLIEKKLSDFV